MYLETYVKVVRLKVLRGEFLITKDPSHILDEKHQTKLPRVIGWKMIKLVWYIHTKAWLIFVWIISMTKKYQTGFVLVPLCILLCICLQNMDVRN